MIKSLITGGIGAGKSALLGAVARKCSLPVEVFSADEAVSRLYGSQELQALLVGLFGERVLVPNATRGEVAVDKEWLRKSVLPFDGPRRSLEKLVHGQVLKELEGCATAARAAGKKVFLAEVPLHYEIGEVISADLVIVVAASRSVQVRRMMENRGFDEATAQAFLNAQWPIETKVEKADVVIWNDGDPSALECQTLLLANLLKHE
jgi:dephospho-CoA kinase